MNHFSGRVNFSAMNTKGQAMVELAMLIPFLLMFVFLLVEYSNLLMTSLKVSSLSRELANAAYRDCAVLENSQVATCLDGIVGRVQDEGFRALSDFGSRGSLIASVYRDPSPKEGDAPDFVGGAGQGNMSTRYSTGTVDAGLINTHGLIAIGEAGYDYKPMTPILRLLDLLSFPSKIYEVTIY